MFRVSSACPPRNKEKKNGGSTQTLPGRYDRNDLSSDLDVLDLVSGDERRCHPKAGIPPRPRSGAQSLFLSESPSPEVPAALWILGGAGQKEYPTLLGLWRMERYERRGGAYGHGRILWATIFESFLRPGLTQEGHAIPSPER